MLNTILIFVQLIISLEFIMEKAFGYSASETLINVSGSQINPEEKNTIVSIMSFIFIITNFVLSGMQQVTLDYFTTDG